MSGAAHPFLPHRWGLPTLGGDLAPLRTRAPTDRTSDAQHDRIRQRGSQRRTGHRHGRVAGRQPPLPRRGDEAALGPGLLRGRHPRRAEGADRARARQLHGHPGARERRDRGGPAAGTGEDGPRRPDRHGRRHRRARPAAPRDPARTPLVVAQPVRRRTAGGRPRRARRRGPRRPGPGARRAGGHEGARGRRDGERNARARRRRRPAPGDGRRPGARGAGRGAEPPARTPGAAAGGQDRSAASRPGGRDPRRQGQHQRGVRAAGRAISSRPAPRWTRAARWPSASTSCCRRCTAR